MGSLTHRPVDWGLLLAFVRVCGLPHLGCVGPPHSRAKGQLLNMRSENSPDKNRAAFSV